MASVIEEGPEVQDLRGSTGLVQILASVGEYDLWLRWKQGPRFFHNT